MSILGPHNDDAERARALGDALENRRARAEIKRKVRVGEMSVAEVLAQGHRGHQDQAEGHARVAGRMKVKDLLLAVKGIGPVKAGKVLAAAGLDGSEHLDVLSAADVNQINTTLGEHR